MEGEVRERTEAEAMTMAFTASEARAMVAGGKWKELVRSFEALASSTNTGVHDNNGNPAQPLDVLAYYFLALYRLRENEKIGRTIEGLASWIAGPTSDGGSPGEQVEPAAPFLLLWVHASYKLLNKGTQDEGLSRMYELLERCRALRSSYQEKLQFDVGSADVTPICDLEQCAPGAANTASLVAAWDRRHKTCACALACHHCHFKQFRPALRILSELTSSSQDREYGALLAHVLLQMGDVRSASKVAEGMARPAGEGGGSDALSGNLDGLLAFARDDFQGCLPKFEKASREAPGEAGVHARNNLAVGHMYSRDLHVSIKILENELSGDRTRALRRPLVLNLCSMYELASTKCEESKRTLHAWLLKNASDDFDGETTRLQKLPSQPGTTATTA